MGTFDACETAISDLPFVGIVGMDRQEGFIDMAAEARRQAGPRHRVPLVAHAAGIQQ